MQSIRQPVKQEQTHRQWRDDEWMFVLQNNFNEQAKTVTTPIHMHFIDFDNGKVLPLHNNPAWQSCSN